MLCAAAAGASARLETLADVLSTLMPLVRRVPGDDWKAAKLYAPHAAKVLAELHGTGHKPTSGAARLLRCGAFYSLKVLLDPQQFLRYEQRLLEVLQAWHGEGACTDVALSLNNVGVAYDRRGKYEQALEYY